MMDLQDRPDTAFKALGLDQYSYDYNGNETKDDQNQVSNMAYDYRNLLLSFRSIKTNIYDAPTEPQTYETRYFYDEAGNRIRKLVKRYIGPPSPQPEYNENDDPFGYWQIVNDEHYVRDASGKEMAIYNGTNLEQWNLWGLDNFGKIDANNQKSFYLKDHLGSIHAIVNQNNEVVYAQDYDAWGYPLEGRSWVQASAYDSKYKFTSKERDIESSYDYFGARYYDARIANWTTIDPLFEKHIEWTPYNYMLRNPIRLIDPNGKQEVAVLRLFWQGAKTATKTVCPYLGIPSGPIGIILNILLSPTTFGTQDIKDVFIIGEEGYLEYPLIDYSNEIVVYSNEERINIHDEDKISAIEIFAPEKRGNAPLSKITGKPVEIHHVDQNPKGPYKEMYRKDHREGDNYKKYHEYTKKSGINRKEFAKEKKEYWEREWDSGRFKNIEQSK